MIVGSLVGLTAAMIVVVGDLCGGSCWGTSIGLGFDFFLSGFFSSVECSCALFRVVGFG